MDSHLLYPVVLTLLYSVLSHLIIKSDIGKINIRMLVVAVIGSMTLFIMHHKLDTSKWPSEHYDILVFIITFIVSIAFVHISIRLIKKKDKTA